MASGNWTGTTSNSTITPRIVWSSTAKDANTNKSDVTVTLQVKKSSSASGSTSGTGAWTVLIDGKTYNFSATIKIPADDTYVTVYTKTVTVDHNLDGTKSISLGWTGGIPGTTYTSTTIADKVVALDTIDRIPQISSFSFTNGYIDQGIDFTINSKVTGETPVADFCILPVNVAVKLLGKANAYQMLGVVTNGNLFMLKKQDGKNVTKQNAKEVLNNKKIGVINLANVPGLTLKVILNDLGIEYSEPTL